MASIRERNGSFRVEWRFGGRAGKPQSVTLPDLELATAAQTLAKRHHHRITDEQVYKAVLNLDDQPALVEVPTVRAWVETWLKRKVDVSPDTLAEYRWLLRSDRVMDRLGDRRLDEVAKDRDMIRDLIASAAAAGLAAATIRKLHSVLHQVFRDAIPKWITENPCGKPPGQRTKGLPPVKRTAAVYLSPAEADLVIGNCRPEIRDLVVAAFGTGLRLGELLALQVGDVDLDGETPIIRIGRARKKSGKVGGPKSEAGERPVVLTDSLVAVLRPRVAGRRKNALVFPSPDGDMWDPRNLRTRYWKRAIVAAARCPEHPPAPEGTTTPPHADPDLLCGDYGGTRSDGHACRAQVEDGMSRCRWHLGPRPAAVSQCDCPGRLHVSPRVHDTRHSHVDFLLDANWDLYDVQLRIGHETLSTTIDMYGNRQRRVSKDKLAALDRVLTTATSGGTA